MRRVYAGAREDDAARVDFLGALPEGFPLESLLPLLPPQALARCGAVCRAWRAQAREEPLWRAHCQALWRGKQVRLNTDSPWVRVPAKMNGGTADYSEAFPALDGGAAAVAGVLLTWRDSYVASLASRRRQALTDQDLVCNDWLITFSEPMLGYLPPEVMEIVHGEAELRASFGPILQGSSLSQRYTDGLFFRTAEPERAAKWELGDWGTVVQIPQAGDGGMLEVSRCPDTWQWTLEHEWLTMTSMAGREVEREGSIVTLCADGEVRAPRHELAHVRWRDSDSDDSDSDDEDE